MAFDLNSGSTKQCDRHIRSDERYSIIIITECISSHANGECDTRDAIYLL